MIPPDEPSVDRPLSSAQRRLWFLDQMGAGAAYNTPMALRLKGRLESESLERALNEIVRRHEILRARFVVVAGQPMQRVVSPCVLVLEQSDLRSVESDVREAEAARLAREETERPFALDHVPILRSLLLRLDDEEHVLVVTAHHSVSDGPSLEAVLLGELTQLYQAYVRGEDSPLPELEIQYGDYANWQREQFDESKLAPQLSYWLRHLQGLTPLQLPTDRSPPELQTFRGGAQDLSLTPELTTGLRELAAREGFSLATILLAAWQLLLCRLSGQRDVVVGSPFGTRNREDLRKLIGVFSNVLVLRTDLSGDPSFRELLSRVREVMLSAFENQDVPFEQLVEQLNPVREPSRHPLFQVLFSMQYVAIRASQAGELQIEAEVLPHQWTDLDLDLRLRDDAGELCGRLIYHADLFDGSTAARLVEQWTVLLQGIVADPGARLSALPLMSDREQRRLLVDWNDTAQAPLADRCIHELFEQKAELTPAAPAVILGDRTLSFGELQVRSNQLARLLVERGVGVGALVGLCLERSPETIVAMLGVLKAGAAYVPMDPTHPRERLSYLLQDTGARIVVTAARFAEGVPDFEGEVICLDRDGALLDAQEQGRLDGHARPDDPAYVLYTSGSTGVPKGVIGLHRGTVNRMRWEWSLAPWEPGETGCHKTNLGFVDSVHEIFGTLCAGVPLVLIPDDEVRDPRALVATLAEHGVSRLVLVPSLLAVLLEQESDLGRQLPQLLRWTASGEPLSRRLAAHFAEQLPRATLWNLYGSTEVSADATLFELEANRWPRDDRRTVPIGRPIANVRTYVLDESMRPLPVGVPGELYIGGVGLAGGYWNRPELTSACFVADPFGCEAGARLFKTGDRARYRPDGVLEYLGRIDGQVKIRGHRIEPGEIESALHEHPRVQRAAVVAREDRPGDQRLIAYVVLQAASPEAPSDAALLQRELLAALQQRLPAYMLPSACVLLEAFPLLPSGKLDREALPAPVFVGGQALFVGPRDGTEEVLCAIWSELLGVERVGIHDDFFALGGHSLLATQLMSRVTAVLGLEVPLRTLFDRPTIAGLARRVESAGSRPSASPLVRREEVGDLPLSPAQQRLWILDQAGAEAEYIIPRAFRLRGVLDVACLERSLREVVRRHEVLRTSFPLIDGLPVQHIEASVELQLQRIELRVRAAEAVDAEVRSLAREEAERPFDLARGPLLRAKLLALDSRHHVLLLSMHHIVSDGWSTGVLYRELTELYAAYRQGAESPLAELGVQYGDFALWQRDWLESAEQQRQLGYWTEQLSDLSLLELPTDRPRPVEQSFAGDSQDFELSPELSSALRQLAHREGATLAMVLLAAWQQLLSLRSGQEDVAVGVPIANRTCVELEPLIGFFVNLLVMRTQLAGDPSFRELLSLVKEVSLAAYEHQDAPFEQVVAALNPVRDRSRSPLFQVLFSMQNAPREELRLDDLEVELLRWGPEGTRFDLELTCIDQRGRLAGRLTYNTALFDRSTIERLRDHLVRLLELVVADPATRGSELRLMSDAEQQRLLVDWNDTAQAPVDDACIQELFDRQAQRTPDATAVEQDDQTLSFGELEARSNQVARLLAQRGVVVGALVGLCLERSPATIVAMLGVLKAGAAYVPLDPEHPSDRLSSLLQDTGARIVLTEERLAARLPAFEGELICLDRDRALIDGQEQSGLELRVRPDDPAYVLYTSGSTGEPKGVVGLHRGAVNRMRWEWSLAPWESGEKGCHKTNLGFVDSVHEIFGALCAGVPLVLIPDHKARDPRALVATLAEHGVSRLVLVPSLLAVLLEQGSDLGRQLPRLRRWTASGEALSRQLAERFAEQLPFATLWNLYGSTEVSADATLFELETTWLESDDRADVPIGRPIANVRAYVLDPSLQPLPVGVPGELHIGGSGLARGYWNRPELTSACFVADPFGDESGGRLYKTGDRARYLDDGTLEYLGRIDSQVKIRGQRVEPGEIESVLHEHPRVQRAVVVAREDRPGDQRLVAYVVLQSGSADAPEVQGQLVSALRQRLPAHMLPSACVLLEAFPLLPSGKLDREALPLPVLERGPAGFVGPRCETENILCAIWTELLGVERVGVHDDFFALGGHSLLAARSVNRIHDKWAGLALSLRSVFEHPTVAGLAASIDALLSPGDTEDAVPGARSVAEEPALARRARSGESPLSFAQQRLWFLDRLGAGSAYNMPVAYRLKGGLDLGSLQRAVLELVRRHEVLRTGIVLVDGVPVQRIAEQVPLDIGLVDLSELESAAREAEIERLAREHALRPFDLSRPPLCRVSVLDCGNDERVLLLTLHHVVSDGWSMELVSTELSLLYEAFTRGAPSPLPDLAFQYADFACWQRERLQGAELERQLTYWRRQLSGLTALQLPVDHPRPAVQGYESASFDFALPGELCEQLRQLARNEGVTLSMLLLAAWQVLLSKSCGTHDVAVGSPIANRTRVELEPLIGFFVNTLVLRGDLSAQQSFAGDLLPRIKECVLAASEHQELPFEKLVEELDPQRDASRHPLFQVAFMLADAPRQTLHLGDLEIERLRLQTAQTGLDLDLRVHDFGDQLGCRLLYDAELFEPTTIERLSGHFSQLLAAIVRDPHARLTELSLMGEQERQLLLETCCRASALGAPDAGLPLVHREFEACAAQRPDATALVHGKRELTYAELNARANQVAHLLRSKGVGPDRIVGLCMQRSPELLIGLLGILKAGGAYLPLDPTLPRERLGLMLGETGVRLLLTLASSQDRLPEHGAEIFCLDREQLALDGAATDDPTWSVAPTDLANAIYTSGSTGLPKAVLVEHAGLSCVSREQLRAFDVGPGTRVLQFASVGFDASLFEIIMALAHGGTLILGDADELLPGPELLAFLRRHAIEVVTLPATALAMLPHEELPDLKILTVAGEACSAELVDRWAPGRRFFNLYGLTETSIWSTMAELSPGDRPHIGRPIGDVCVYPLDPHGRLTPIGVVGDIHLGGTGIARGYRGRARLTAERFVPDPFSPIAGARLYRTGDLARFRHDGCLEFIGRADSQIKLRGQRIEPREIEAALSALPGVEQAVVVPRGEDLDRRLVAYLVGSGGGVPAQRELREALGRILPTYMLPADYEVLTELPRNSSGKIDRAALPEPTRQGIDSNTREPPETATEKVVASIWSELLETRAVGRHDHFIDLGGHSLLAVTVLERMQEELGVKIPPRDLLFGTLLQVAAACDAILANPPRRGSWFSRLVSRLIRRRHRRERAG